MFKLLKKFDKKDIGLIMLSILLIVVQVFLELKIPDYMTEITTLIQTEGTKINDVLVEGAYMMSCALLSLLTSIGVGYIAASVSSNFSYDLRDVVFDKVEKFSTAEIKKFQTSSLITRTTNDISQLETIIAMGLQAFIKAPIMAVWAISKILTKNIEWSALVGGFVLLLLITVISLMVVVLPRFEIVQKLIDKVNGVTRENLTGIRVVRAFNAEDFQKNRFDKVNTELTKTQLFNQRCFAILNPVMNLVMHGLTLGIYFIGAYLIASASMLDKINLFSNMVVFSSYGMQVIMSFLLLALIFMMWPRAQISANRINEVLECDLSILDGDFGGQTKEKGVVEFKNVSFKYPDASEYLIKNISFKANKGDVIAFIGSTGSGKSTLINLVPRFYDVTDGEILVDGIDVREYKLSNLRNKIGYVSQKAFMFTATVSENVSYGDNGKEKPSKDAIKKAIDVACATEFVSKMSGNYDAPIARGGTNVSGGQKQRLSIARAIARDPEIYIFDDTFSALDFKTDALLRKNLKEYTNDATILLVAQRIGTIMNADKIIVLDKGKCVGMGTHKELLKSCPVYQEIALSQLSKEELENA